MDDIEVGRAGVPLRQLLIAVGDPLVDVLAAPRGFDVKVRDVVIVDPEEEFGSARDGDFVLVIGARGRAAVRLVRSAARDGATAAAVKVNSDGDARALRDAAMDCGIALLGVRPEVRWEQLESFARAAIDNVRFTQGADTGEVLGDLFSLAQTVAAMTGGIVSIEDTASRVLAYSRSDDEVDELRRLSILGRQGPEQYLAMLRDWGVYRRLRAGEEPVWVEERPELGIRRRVAIGIHAGRQPLGAIWVQEGKQPLAEQAERALVGAARVAALHLIRQRTEAGAGPRFRENLLSGLLDGRIDADSVAGNIGADPEKPAVVVALNLRSPEEPADQTELELRREEMKSLVSVHASAYRRSALVTVLGSRIYVLLPELVMRSAVVAARGLTRDIVAAARNHLRVRVQAGIGSVVPSLEEVPDSRREADRILDAMSHDLDVDVATIADVRAKVVLSELVTFLQGNERLQDSRLAVLFEHDAQHSTELARSLLSYLEAFGDVRVASDRLHIHPNTLRYRVRRCGELTGIDFQEPAERLNAHLQLLLARRLRRLSSR
ncbi:PucR family transcriptional regulator [Saccharopolyspora rectivirgula]|uniref:PucR family transcriptional regulator n=1 Tax=Saccharopolyspora rectivirgula TaxID=28042 RepID=UPI000406F1CE|nr:helix-turn-helix domain-containing protein [Saccharopolyspora rectivirgula]